jgi:hypothetical protein
MPATVEAIKGIDDIGEAIKEKGWGRNRVAQYMDIKKRDYEPGIA